MAKNFFASLMASEDVKTLMFTGKFYNSSDALAEIHDGAIVVKGAMETNGIYNLKDPNVYKITAPAADTAAVCIVDYVDVSRGSIMGVEYREGIKTFGLTAPAGVGVRVRIPKKHDTGLFAAGNFASAPTVGKYAVPTADGTLWTPSDSLVTTKTCIKIEFEKDAVTGMINDGKEYFVTFVNVIE